MKVDFKFLGSGTSENQELKNSIYFMHIPKCGGTTIDHIFFKLSLVLKTFDFKRFTYQNENERKKFLLSNLEINTPSFISGHLDYNFSDNLNDVFRFTIVRKPVDRIISHYKFKVLKLASTPDEYNFDSFIKEEVNNSRDNLITRHFLGLLDSPTKLNEAHCDKAIDNIKYFDKINIFENWDSFVSELLTDFSFPSILYSKFQQHKYSFVFEINEKHVDLIEKYYAYDIALFNEVCKISKNNEAILGSDFNKKICIVSPHIETENKLYTADQIKKIFNKN